jgi:hypothetical protein
MPPVHPPPKFAQRVRESGKTLEQLAPLLNLVDTIAKDVESSFQEYDNDKSGFLETNELLPVINDLFNDPEAQEKIFGKKFDEETVKQYVKEFDTNNDGKLDLNEFWDFCTNLFLTSYLAAFPA